MTDRNRPASKPSSTQDVTDFEPLGNSDEITVGIVMVPPRGAPHGWGHTASGACVQFTNSREAMLQLYHRLREAGRTTPVTPLVIDAHEIADIRTISRGECPIHVLPEIAPGTAVAFAPY